jgi:D-glycero-alpha-D-manno-heptose-7-phosphate kinase
MIISRTPFRISFFGGGTDYPAWYRNHGGAVLATTIDKYCYISCRYLPPFFEHRFCVIYSKMECCQTIDEIAHPAVRAVLHYLNIERGVEIHHDGGLPARSGMGSSSAFTVGLLHALYALKGQMATKRQLAKESMYLQQECLKEPVGSQDQVLAAHGGFNHISFLPNGEVSVRPITLSRARLRELNDHLMLFYTGFKRTASPIAESSVNGTEARKRQLRFMKDLVDESITLLVNGRDLHGFGELLHEAWKVKRSWNSWAFDSQADAVYQQARSAGAVGGKLTGAGRGGFLLLFVPPGRQAAVRERLTTLIHVPFKIEFSGSQIIYYDPEMEYEAEEKMRAHRSRSAFGELNSGRL